MSTKLPILTRSVSLSGPCEYVFHINDWTQSSSVVRRTTFVDREHNRYYSRTPWIYYLKESPDSPPILLNRHEAGHIVDSFHFGHDPKWYIKDAKERSFEIIYSCNYTDKEWRIYNEIYRGSNYKLGWLQPIPDEGSDLFYIVQKRVHGGKIVVYSEPVFIRKSSASVATVYHQNIDNYLSLAGPLFLREGD